MNGDAIQPFPELPFELVCLIIEAILEIEPRKAVELVCLSRDIQPIVERALHRCITKVLCCTHALEIDALQSIFPACSGLQQIGIFLWAWEGKWPEALTPNAALDDLASTGPRPSKLSCDFHWIQRLDGSDCFSLPLFQNVTHFELDVADIEDFDALNHLHSLTNLTHVSFVDTDIINDTITDPRIVIASDLHQYRRDHKNGHILWRDLADCKHYIRQWGQRLEEDELDMWEEAEEIVKVQRAKTRIQIFATSTLLYLKFPLPSPYSAQVASFIVSPEPRLRSTGKIYPGFTINSKKVNLFHFRAPRALTQSQPNTNGNQYQGSTSDETGDGFTKSDDSRNTPLLETRKSFVDPSHRPQFEVPIRPSPIAVYTSGYSARKLSRGQKRAVNNEDGVDSWKQVLDAFSRYRDTRKIEIETLIFQSQSPSDIPCPSLCPLPRVPPSPLYSFDPVPISSCDAPSSPAASHSLGLSAGVPPLC
ncbi:hypothetical protein C8J56DRAFT_1095042 [Mycena floridula]|nr:hypothetical protein C8J56DRAFT_1095042 [Mycena floridula]